MTRVQESTGLDRGQMDGGRSHLVAGILVAGAVLVIVLNEVLSLSPSEVERVCGYCGCGPCPAWWYAVAGVLLAVPVGVFLVRFFRARMWS